MFISFQFWMLLALGSGIGSLAVDAMRKSILITSSDHEWVVMFRLFSYVLPFVFVWWLISGKQYSVSNIPLFGIALIVGIICEIIAQRHYQIAVKAMPLSVCRPMMEMTMIVMIPLSYILLKMPINLHSFGAIIVFLIGIFVINSEGEGSWVENILKSLRNENIRSIGWVVLFWSMTTVLQKVCLQYTNPPFFTLCLSIGLLLGMIPLLYRNGITVRDIVGSRFDGRYLVSGLVTATMAGLQFSALSYPGAHPSVVIILKRASQLAFMVIDQRVFRIRITFTRVLGNLLAFAGIVLIAL